MIICGKTISGKIKGNTVKIVSLGSEQDKRKR